MQCEVLNGTGIRASDRVWQGEGAAVIHAYAYDCHDELYGVRSQCAPMRCHALPCAFTSALVCCHVLPCVAMRCHALSQALLLLPCAPMRCHALPCAFTSAL
eukprot:350013-Chlamydomonas_euryale.AAC.1